jgi:DnaJ-like protein
MKQRLLASAISGLAFIFFCAGSALAQGGELVAAEWGLQGRRVDVTGALRSMARDGAVRFEVTRQNLGADPAPGRVKFLTIHIRHWDGSTQEYTFREHAMVNLEIDPERGYDRREWEERREEGRDHHEHGVHIIRAYYGAEGQFMNVTEALRSRVDDGRLRLRIDDSTMGGDPLPGRRKWLRVLYFSDGERRNAVVEEKTELRLP